MERERERETGEEKRDVRDEIDRISKLEKA